MDANANLMWNLILKGGDKAHFRNKFWVFVFINVSDFLNFVHLFFNKVA